VQLIAQLWQELAVSLALPGGTQEHQQEEATDALPESEVRQIIQEYMSDATSSDQDPEEQADDEEDATDSDGYESTSNEEQDSCYGHIFK
jgi:hypothetical protein